MARTISVLVCSILCGLLSLPAIAQTEKPTLILDPGGHIHMLQMVAFTPDGQQLISWGNKTIRVWDAASGDLLRTHRLPIYPGATGAVALAPDGKVLALGWPMPPAGDSKTEYCIYLVELLSGRVTRSQKVASEGFSSLGFSRDGKSVATGSTDGVVRVYRLSSNDWGPALRGHTQTVTAAAFSPYSKRLLTSSLDNTARIWNIETGNVETVIRDAEGQSMNVVTSADWSADGKLLATGGFDRKVHLWSPSGRHIRACLQVDIVRRVRFSPDGEKLIFTGQESGILETTTGRTLTTLRRLPFGQFVNSAAFSPDGTLALTGGIGDLWLWKTATGELVRRLGTSGEPNRGAAWGPDGQTIAWGTTADPTTDAMTPVSATAREAVMNAPHPLERTFNISRLEFGGPPDNTFVRMTPPPERMTVHKIIEKGFVNTVIREDGKDLCMLSDAGYGNNYTFLPNDKIAMGDVSCLMLFEARTGKLIRRFERGDGKIHATSRVPGGRYILTAGSKLRIWKPDEELPLLSLFFAGEDWVAWTPEGYYATSPSGERLMGWHVNNGPDELASFYPASQFRATLYRPDVIKLLLTAGSVKAALAEADKARGRMTVKTEAAAVLPPSIKITSPKTGYNASRSTLEVRATATSTGTNAVTSLRLLLDGRPYQGLKGVQTVADPKLGEVEKVWQVELEPGKHKLKVLADSAVSQGVSEDIEVVYVGGEADAVQLPKLYIVAIGISEYPGELKLNYAAKDAQALGAAMKSHSKSLFRDIEVQTITDATATRAGVLKGLSWLRGQMTQNDYGIFFFAGHGELDNDGSLYFLPVDGDAKDLVSSAVPADQVKRVLSGIPGKLITIFDACHSAGVAGSTTGKRRSSSASLTDDLVRDLVTDENGVIAMCSSTGREFSLENNEHRQGSFTLSIIEGLSGKADFNKDGVVYLNELDTYVTDRVKELTKGQQHPVTAKPGSIRSFPLAKP